jgi:hypothetical protein
MPARWVWCGSIVAVFGCLGIVFGGRLADWMAKRGSSDANMRVTFTPLIGAVPFVNSVSVDGQRYEAV